MILPQLSLGVLNQGKMGLLQSLKLELHQEKSRTCPLYKDKPFLGFPVFYHHKIVKKSNLRRMKKRISEFRSFYGKDRKQDQKILRSVAGWCAYAMQGDTHRLRKRVIEDLMRGVVQFTGKQIYSPKTNLPYAAHNHNKLQDL